MGRLLQRMDGATWCSQAPGSTWATPCSAHPAERRLPEPARRRRKRSPCWRRPSSRELAAAEGGFKARHILCQALTALLGSSSDDATRLDLVGRITDAVEDGLGLARTWDNAGVTTFRPLATELFHLGALIYENHQPHFLAEFLLDHLDPVRAGCAVPGNEGWHAIAGESLSRVRREIRNTDFGLLATPPGRRRLETLGEVRSAEARLEALR